MPPLPALGEDPAAARRAFGEALEALDRWFSSPGADDAHEAVATRRPFYLSYQEQDNRPLLSRYGALCHRLMDRWQQARGIRPAAPSASGRIRVGIVGSNFCSHSVWTALVKGIVLHLDPAAFELHLFHLGAADDRETALARSRAAGFTQGGRSLQAWSEAILRCRPEVLLYPEVGMHALTSQLASLRLAPVQAALWGHPETTGLPTIDYFISADGLEPDGAEAHYSETLLRLPNLGCHYGRQADAGEAAAPGSAPEPPGEGPLLVCPGTSFKYMPDHDWVYAEIARRLGRCRLLFFSQQPRWTSILQRRLAAAFADRQADFGSVAFVPWLGKAEFLALLRRADVFLDTLGFSGFNTAMQAVECGLPVVTRRGRFMRGRLAAAILDRMGMEELVAVTEDDYVAQAVRLARDDGYRRLIRAELRHRQSVLFDDTAPIRALERLLRGLCRRPSGIVPTVEANRYGSAQVRPAPP